ncbi:MAG: hypothetical protein OHK0053_01920 [Microscillaceae bacterium]
MEGNRWDFFKIFVRLILFMLAFLVLVQWMTLACKQLNRDWIAHILVATSNPFLALFIGLLITALVQSSSVVTSMLVAMVASDTLTLESAVFMVMGANIGTTVTSTFVSLGHVTRRKEFRKAIAAATAHNFFNIFTAILLLPLEYFFGILSRSATQLADMATLPREINFFAEINLSRWLFLPVAEYLQWLFVSGVLGLVVAFALLFLIIKNMAFQLQDLLMKKSGYRLENSVLAHPLKSLGLGIFITGLVQSSSLVTSLIVPVVASNQLSLKKAFPFIMGANVGTTFTALLAALPASESALSLAFSHMLFNMFGVIFFFPFPWLRNLPIRLARRLGKATLKNRLVGFSYILLTFFIVPFFLIFLTKGKISIRQYEYIQQIPVKFPEQPKKGDSLFFKKKRPASLIVRYRVEQFKTQANLIDSPTSIVVKQAGDTLFLNQLAFLMCSSKSCLQGEDSQGVYLVCLEAIKSPFILSPQSRFDSCYIFSKKYRSAIGPRFEHRYYLHLRHRILLKKEVLDSGRRLYYRETILDNLP